MAESQHVSEEEKIGAAVECSGDTSSLELCEHNETGTARIDLYLIRLLCSRFLFNYPDNRDMFRL